MPQEKLDKEGNVVEVIETKHVPGDTLASIFYLKNRAPDRWKDRTEVAQVDVDGKSLVQLTAIELAKQLISGGVKTADGQSKSLKTNPGALISEQSKVIEVKEVNPK